ncbi:hypothetical protein ACFC63_13295 [Streptomyces albidoflavus]
MLDTNHRRSAANALSIAGFKNTPTLAAAIKLVVAYDQNSLSSSSTNGIHNEDHLKLATEMPGIQDASHFGLRLWKAIRITPSAAAASSYITRRERDASIADEHWKDWEDGIITGAMLPANDPRLHLREAMKKRAATSISQSVSEEGRVKIHATRDIARMQIALYILAFNAWVQNKRPRTLHWNPQTDTMPVVTQAPFAKRTQQST